MGVGVERADVLLNIEIELALLILLLLALLAFSLSFFALLVRLASRACARSYAKAFFFGRPARGDRIGESCSCCC